MNLARVFEQTQCYTMYRRITPSLVEEPACSVQMIEVILVCLTSPEAQICDFEIGPEMTCRIPVCLHVMLWSSCAISQPLHRMVLVQIFWMLCHELCRLWP